MKKITALWLSLLIVLSMTSCSASDSGADITSEAQVSTAAETETALAAQNESEPANLTYKEYASMSAEEIVSHLTLEQKAAQMVQCAVYSVTPEQMKENCYGSILSKYNSVTYDEWQDIVDSFQEAALASDASIPYLYGQDDVHGVNYCEGAVIFPHNIGIGAANDPELTYKMGLAVADEAKLCHMLWNFAPCVAQSDDLRWGRTYESYGSDLGIITELSTSFTKGLTDGGVIACAKHFFADGNVSYGTGECSDVMRTIDRGNSELSDDEIKALLDVYKAQIDAGAQTVMISHSALNGVKMHENAEYIMKLKDEMGLEGFIVSDWNSVQNTSPSTYEEQVITSVNAGIDMLMEVDDYETARQIIISAAQDGRIPNERIDDAVRRIIKVKLEEGIFDDPMCDNISTVKSETGSDEYRALARQLVSESLVLLKNDGDVLPLKSGATVYVTGPAADNAQIQCGGWTIDWNSSPSRNIVGVTTVLDGFKEVAAEYGINVVTDEKDAANADVVLLVVGENAYAEWNGDTPDAELCGALGARGNEEAIEEAAALGKPTVACIVAGRQVIMSEYTDKWDSVVMCYLPGSEGAGVADVLCGKTGFSGKLPSKWYSSLEQLGTDECEFDIGYGLTY